MSRPTKFTNDVVQKLEEAFKVWATIEEACSYADISRSSYYEWLDKNHEFSDKISLSKKYLVLKSRMVIAKSLEEWDVRTAMWYLERKRKTEFVIPYIKKENEESEDRLTKEEEELVFKALEEHGIVYKNYLNNK